MKLVILDRDGVINEAAENGITSPDQWQPLPGSLDAIARLCRAGYRVLVATNQAGIARGLLSLEDLHAIHRKMNVAIAEAGGVLDAIYFCPHLAEDHCHCRKPAPGLLLEIAARVRSDLDGVPAVGDSLQDLQAAVSAGARPVLVRTGRGRATEARLDPQLGVPVFDDLAQAVEFWLSPTDPLEAER
jgi:D-glycero-D-manno-heptose 1,7-bisphosphate phosphatase